MLHINFPKMRKCLLCWLGGVEEPRQGPRERQLAVAERTTADGTPHLLPPFPCPPPVPLPTSAVLENVLSSSLPSHYLHQPVHTTTRWWSVTSICCICTEQLRWLWSNVQVIYKEINANLFAGKSHQVNGNIYLCAYLFICLNTACWIHIFWTWTDKCDRSSPRCGYIFPTNERRGLLLRNFNL